MAGTIKLKRGVYSLLPALTDGEPGWCTDNFKLYIGQGGANKLVGETDFLKLSGGSLTNFLSLHANPTAALHAATKSYVDSVATGLDVKASVKLATTAALPACTAGGSGVGKTLTMNAVGVLTVDEVATVLNDRVLVKNQATGADNGIYRVTTEGTAGAAAVLTRATDADQAAEVTAGMFTFAEKGTANGDKGFVLTTDDPITVDTTALAFSQFAGSSGSTTFIELTDTPADYTNAGSKAVRVNAGATALEFIDFAATYLEAAPTNGETNKAPNSDWAFDHNAAETGIHGAGVNTLLNSSSVIDGGTF